MRGLILICDFAEVLNGKLYIMGGGWSRFALTPGRPFVDVSVAAKIYFPWTSANKPVQMEIALFTEDGGRVTHDGQPIQVSGAVEVGRPPGLPNGTEIDLPITWKFNALPLAVGRYEWQLIVDGQRLESAVFDVVNLPG